MRDSETDPSEITVTKTPAEDEPCGHRSPMNYDHTRWAVCSLTKGHDGDHREGDRTWREGYMPSKAPEQGA